MATNKRQAMKHKLIDTTIVLAWVAVCIVSAVLLVGCKTIYTHPGTGEVIPDPVSVDTDGDGKTDHWVAPGDSFTPLEEDVVFYPPAAEDAAKAAAPFLPFPFNLILPAVAGLATTIRKESP